MADDAWFYARAGQQHGPVAIGQLMQMAQSGQLMVSDLVWTECMSDWVSAGSVPQLFPPAPPLHPPDRTYPASPQTPYVPGMTPMPVQYGYARTEMFAGFWMRVAASIIDGIVLLVGGFCIGGLVGGVIGAMVGARGGDVSATIDSISPLFDLLGTLIGWLYSALMESSATQATLGKMALGIKVTDIHGARITFGRATGRHFAKILSVMTLLVGFMMAGFTEKKQALHDMIAGTLVVRR